MILKIGFSKPKNSIFPIYSWAIRAIYCTKYSHVYVRWYSNAAEADIVYEASGTSVKFKAGSIFDKKAETVHSYELEIDRETYRKLLNYCMNNAGVSYGIAQALGIAIAKLFKLDKNPFSNDRKAQVCSELVGAILKCLTGIVLPIDLDMASPKDIKEILDSNPHFKKVL